MQQKLKALESQSFQDQEEGKSSLLYFDIIWILTSLNSEFDAAEVEPPSGAAPPSPKDAAPMQLGAEFMEAAPQPQELGA